MGSTSTNALLFFPARLHAPLLEALQQRSDKRKSSSSGNSQDATGQTENDGLVCSLDDGSASSAGVAASATTRVLARRDLSRESDLFLFEPLACGTRSRLARAATEDEAARSLMSSVVAEAAVAAGAAPPAPFAGSEALDPLLGNLWRWLVPAGAGVDAGGSGRPDARWVLPPREIAWAQHSEEGGRRGPNARVSLLTLDDDSDGDDDDEGDDDGEKEGVEKREGEKQKEDKLLLVLWLEESVARGEPVTLDWSFETETPNFRGSLRRAASLVARLRPEGRWSEPQARERLAAAVAAAAAAGTPAGGGGAAERRQQQARQGPSRAPSSLPPPPPTRDGGGGDDDQRGDFLVWTDYPVFSEWLDALEGGRGASCSPLGFLPRSGVGGEKERRRRRLRRTRDRASADLVLSRLPLRSFFEGGNGRKEPGQQQQLCNQFPFEGALVRKDMLPSTARSAFSCRIGESGRGGGRGRGRGSRGAACFWPPSPDGLHPPWLPPTFDLSTELHLLLRGIGEGEREGSAPPPWILKPAQASRSLGLAVSAAPATLAAFAMRATAGGDRVAQRYVERPLLTRDGRKFDLRLYVVVRSFGGGGGGAEGGGEEAAPPRASLYSRFHAREAPRRYAAPGEHSSGLISQSVFGTVACYNEGGGRGDGDGGEEREGGARDPFLPRAAVDETLRSRGCAPRAVAAAVASLARQVVEAGAGVVGGPWPGSRAVYGLDVVLDESERTRVEMGTEAEAGERKGAAAAAAAAASKASSKEDEAKSSPSASASVHLVPTPRLLEVNFAPDLGVAARFNPDLPGLLLREMLREEDDEEEDGMFLSLF